MTSSGKEKLCNALCRLASGKPVSEVSIASLIKEAGVSRNTFYYHFDSVEDMLREMMTVFCTEYLDKLQIPSGELERILAPKSRLQLEQNVVGYIAKKKELAYFFLEEQNYRLFHKIFSSCFRVYCDDHRIVQVMPDGSIHPVKHGVFYDYFVHITCQQHFAILELWAARKFCEVEEDFIHIFDMLYNTVVTVQGA